MPGLAASWMLLDVVLMGAETRERSGMMKGSMPVDTGTPEDWCVSASPRAVGGRERWGAVSAARLAFSQRVWRQELKSLHVLLPLEIYTLIHCSFVHLFIHPRSQSSTEVTSTGFLSLRTWL